MKKLRFLTFTLLLASALFLPVGVANDVPFADVPFDVNNIPEPIPPPPAVVDFFDLDPFYQQWINIKGFPVLASANVNPYAVKENAWEIGQIIGHRSDILNALAKNRIRYTLIAHNEVVSDIPELSPHLVPHFYENQGRGGACWYYCKTIFGSEEWTFRATFWDAATHEMAHGIHEIVNLEIDTTFDQRLETVYNAAMAKDLWHGSWLRLNKYEYWAEGVTTWFHANPQSPIKTRDAFKAYDPDFAQLIIEVFGDSDWRYTPIRDRLHLPHLQGLDLQAVPREVEWPPGVLEAYEELRDPAINERSEWVNLPPYDPSMLPHLNELRNRSQPDRYSVGWTNILVGSLVDAEILFYWVNPDGTETLFYRFAPGLESVFIFQCRVGDLLLAKDTTGRPLAVFQAVEKVGRVLVAPTLHLIKPGLSKVSGDNQTGVSGAVLVNPFVVEVRADNLSVLEGVVVTFAVTAGDGTLSVTRATTDKNGRAESVLTLGSNLGTNTVSVSADGIEGTVIFNAVAEAAVDIPDLNLRTAIESALGKTSGVTITMSDMARLTHLDAQNANISDLTGLQHAINLTQLGLGAVWVEAEARSINSNSITDISALAGLTNLTSLDLGANSVSNISALAGLTDLTWLYLGTNLVWDISALAGLTNLTSLDLREQSVSDISSLVGLTDLTSLDLGANSVSDISALAGLTNLKRLSLVINSVSDISALAGLTDLTQLYLYNNTITDISPLVENTGLGSGDEVHAHNNPLSYQSIHTHIPALQSRGVTVEYDADGTRPPDVNGDGSVNVLDLIAIASDSGKTGANLAADVNGDGVVSILDLTFVAGMFE